MDSLKVAVFISTAKWIQESTCSTHVNCSLLCCQYSSAYSIRLENLIQTIRAYRLEEDHHRFTAAQTPRRVPVQRLSAEQCDVRRWDEGPHWRHLTRNADRDGG